nr:LicD family protein [Streptococcus ovuberis]
MKEFDQICREQSFDYSLGGGTLLGAVRHGGFIPWDDDVDIMMPRPDYEKFLSYCQKNNVPFDCLSCQYSPGYNDLFARLSDKSTVVVADHLSVASQQIGICIDIFPIDGLGDTEEKALRQFRRNRFRQELLIASKWKNYFRSQTRSIWYEPIRMLFFLISRMVDSSKLCRILDREFQKVKFSTANYSACISGTYREREIMKTSIFSKLSRIEFEGIEFLAIANYHSYLTKHYDKYMELPPEHKRKAHHNNKIYWKDF